MNLLNSKYVLLQTWSLLFYLLWQINETWKYHSWNLRINNIYNCSYFNFYFPERFWLFKCLIGENYLYNFFHDLSVDLDIRSYYDEERHNIIVKEVIRIIKANVRGSTTFPYTDLRIMSSYSRSETVRNMYNHMISVSYRKTDP